MPSRTPAITPKSDRRRTRGRTEGPSASGQVQRAAPTVSLYAEVNAGRSPAPLTVPALLQLQRTVGNHNARQVLTGVRVQRITHNGKVVDVDSLTLAEVKIHLGRLKRLQNGAGKGTDSEFAYDSGDLTALEGRKQTLEEQELEKRRLKVVSDLAGRLTALGTATDFTVQPPWAGKSPTGAEGTETFNSQALKPEQVEARWKAFLGAGAYCHKQPRTGADDPTRLVSSDGLRSIRYGTHEQTSAATLHHFHEETWVHDSIGNTVTVSNVVRRVPVK